MQCAFLAALYATGSVSAAAKAVGKSRETAYRLRTREGAASFAAAWDRILAGPAQSGALPERSARVADWRKVTLQDLQWQIETGLWRPVIFRGQMRAVQRKADNSALLHLLSRFDKQLARVEGEAS